MDNISVFHAMMHDLNDMYKRPVREAEYHDMVARLRHYRANHLNTDGNLNEAEKTCLHDVFGEGMRGDWNPFDVIENIRFGFVFSG